jgi:hypothetical protein
MPITRFAGYTADAVREKLTSLAKQYGGQANLAAELGVSRSLVNDTIHGRTPPYPALLDALGLEKTVLYTRKAAP